MAGFDEIPELIELEAGRQLIRIPMEQNVPLTPRVRALIDCAEFQRLNHVTQLGLVHRVYPGARHTRFEHALGVYHNALRYLQQLRRDRRFLTLVSVHQAEVLIASALLHDLGHWPFCHPIEDMALPGMPPHESHASRFLSPQSELAEVLRREWSIDPAEVLDILTKGTNTSSQRLLRSILSGPIDIDKMDYLERDSLHCGVPYGRHFDKQRLIQSLVLNEKGDGLAITSKGKTAAELMVFARYVMFSEVYWHHAVRAATSMFARGFYEIYRDVDLTQLFGMNEEEMIDTLRRTIQQREGAGLLEGIFGSRREIYKRAAEFSHYQSEEVYQRVARRPFGELVELSRRVAERLSREWDEPVAATDILIDAPPPHREIEMAIDVFFPKENVYRPLKIVSPVVDALARTQFDEYVKRVRVFVAPKWKPRIAGTDWTAVVSDSSR
jgi:HD superfamily phosphohydrolase